MVSWIEDKKTTSIYIGMLLSIILLGGYFEFSSALLSIYFTVCLFIALKNESFVFINKTVGSILGISLLYLFVIPFSIDLSMGIIGFIKYLPLIPAVFLIAKLSIKQRESLLSFIPMYGLIMIIFSFLVSFHEGLNTFFNVSNRLSGLFQYPNTFALFLLVGIIVQTYKEDNIWKSSIILIGLLSGIFLTGSRTGLLLLGVFVLVSVVLKETRKKGILLCCFLGIGIVCTLGYVVLCGDTSTIARYLTTSLSSSTFVGRVLYYLDAFPVIMKNPLGLGYMGYQYLQGSFQTGVYNVAYVHNDFLQFFLDAGWLAGILFMYVTGKAILSKNNPSMFRIIALFMAMHTMLDFHFQFLSIFLLYLLVLDYSPKDIEKKNIKRKGYMKTYKVSQSCSRIISSFIIIVSVYLGSALFFEYINEDDLSLAIYPINSRIYMDKIFDSEDIELNNTYADNIINNGNNNALSYRTKADWYFKAGMLEETIENKLKQIELAKYDKTAYEELIVMLVVFKDLYEEAEIYEGVFYCEDTLRTIPNMLDEVAKQTSTLAYQIDEVPDLELSDEYIYYCYN